MKIKILFSALLIVHCLLVTVSFTQWSTSPDPDGSLYVCPGFTPTIRTTQDGSSFIFGMASYNLWLQKLDPYGFKQWMQPTQVYKNAGSVFVYTLPTVLDNDGGIIVWWKDDRNAELDRWFSPTQNALYMQRVNKFGQKVWSDTGIQIAPLDGGIKWGYGVDDGAGGVILFFVERDFYRTNKTNKEYSKLIRYNTFGKKEWEVLIDTSSINGTIPNSQPYRLKQQILYYSQNGWKVIDTAGNKMSPPSIIFGGIIIDVDTTILSIQSSEIIDSLNRVHLKLKLTKISNMWDSIWTSSFISSDSVYLGDGGSSVLPNVLLDNSGGIFFSYGYYIQQPRSYHLYIQRVNKFGGQWVGDGMKIVTNDWPIRAFSGKGELGLIYYDYSHQKYDLNGDSLLQQRVKVFNATDFDIDNEAVTSDNNGGAIIAFWRGGIFAQHTGRTGKLGQITSVKTSATIPQDFVLYQNYPNPFNANTIIEYQIPRKEKITLKMYDVIGREIVTILDEVVGAGTYRANFDASTLSSGIYYYRLQTKDYVQVRKMVMVK